MPVTLNVTDIALFYSRTQEHAYERGMIRMSAQVFYLAVNG